MYVIRQAEEEGRKGVLLVWGMGDTSVHNNTNYGWLIGCFDVNVAMAMTSQSLECYFCQGPDYWGVSKTF